MAGQDVQQLLLKIDASTELARRELRKMDGDFETFTRRSEQAAASADDAFAGLGKAATLAKASIIGFAVGIGIEGVVSFGRAVLDAADNLDAAAEKAGIGVERYQALKESLRALEVDGDKVDAIFGRLTDTLGAVQGGTAGEGVVRVLDQMGITTRILNGEIDTTDELLDAIAASAGKFGSQAEFTAATIDLVGKKLGVDLANAIKDGGAALKAGEASFIAAGGVVDAEYIAKLADANEAVDRFTSNTNSKLIIWAAQTLGIFQTVSDGVEGVKDVFNKEGIGAGVASLFDEGTNARGRSIRVRREILATPFDPSANGLPGFDTATVARLPAATSRSTVRADSRAAPRGSATSFTPAQLRAGLDRGDAALPFGDLGGALVDLDAIAAAIDRVGASAVDLSNVEILDFQALSVGVGLLEDASFAITNGLIGAENLGDALVDTFARAGAALLQSGLLNLLSGGTQGTSFGDAFKGLGSLFSGKGFAGGGRPPVGKFSMVGERGPELFMPSVPGTIIPNHMLGAGGGTVQNFDLRGALVTEDVLARIDAMGARAAQAGAIGGRTLAADDSARRRRRQL